MLVNINYIEPFIMLNRVHIVRFHILLCKYSQLNLIHIQLHNSNRSFNCKLHIYYHIIDRYQVFKLKYIAHLDKFKSKLVNNMIYNTNHYNLNSYLSQFQNKLCIQLHMPSIHLITFKYLDNRVQANNHQDIFKYIFNYINIGFQRNEYIYLLINSIYSKFNYIQNIV